MIILFLIIVGLLSVAYEHRTSKGDLMKGEHKILLLTADPSEPRPGIGAVDMAFVFTIKNDKITQITPIYPGDMAHPTAIPPDYLKNRGLEKLYLHDTLWWEDAEFGAKLAQETVEHNTGIKTDIVVIVTPEAVDAIIEAVGPVYVPGVGYVHGSSIDFLREEQKGGLSRGDAVESLIGSITQTLNDRTKYLAFTKACVIEYGRGNIVVVPEDVFLQFVVSNRLYF